MNNKNSSAYSMALLMSLFLCSVETKVISSEPDHWPAQWPPQKNMKPKFDLAQYKETVLRKLGENHIITTDMMRLEKEIEDGTKSVHNYFKKMNAPNASQELRQHYQQEAQELTAELKPKILHLNALKDSTRFIQYYARPMKEEIKKIKAAKSERAVNAIYEQIKSEGVNKRVFEDVVKDETDILSTNPNNVRLYGDLDYNVWKIKNAAKTPQVPLTWFSRFKRWLNGEPSSTFDFVQHPPQQSSMRVPPMSPMRKQMRARYAAFKQQAVKQFPENMTPEKQKQINRYTAKPGSRFIEPY
jgi:hypothetical protein